MSSARSTSTGIQQQTQKKRISTGDETASANDADNAHPPVDILKIIYSGGVETAHDGMSKSPIYFD